MQSIQESALLSQDLTQESRPRRPEHLLHDLRRLIQEAEEIDTRYYEQGDFDAICGEFVSRIRKVLDTIEYILTHLREYYEPIARREATRTTEPTPDLSFDSSINQLISTTNTARRITDIAFVARLELSRKRRQLMALSEDSSRWKYLVVCDSIRRRVLKSADSLEHAVCEYEHLESNNTWHEKSLSLAVKTRRAYSIFTQALHADALPSAHEVRSRLLSIGTALAKLMGREISDSFKASDRRMLHTIQRRIWEWLLAAGEPLDTTRARSGIRLWQDVVGFSSLLMQISHRPELREHDRSILAKVRAIQLAGTENALSIQTSQLEILPLLYGLDPVLDDCIDAGTACSINQLRLALERLQSHHALADAEPPRW